MLVIVIVAVAAEVVACSKLVLNIGLPSLKSLDMKYRTALCNCHFMVYTNTYMDFTCL